MAPSKYMLQSLTLAENGIGQTSPNPLVGCVIVKNGEIVGDGWHQKYGEAHAEINALKQAGAKAKDAEMFVTLEPCCHFGKTPPCTEAILKAGIRKVYIAMLDPNPFVAGKGADFLRKNGIEVEIGLEEEKAKKLNEKFIHFIKNKTPFVALKIATTADEKITRSDGEQWITNEKSLKKAHQLRNEYDAILVGKNTVLADNPSLTTYRIPNGRNPIRVILDSNLELTPDKKVFADANFILVTKTGHSPEKKQKYLEKGGTILEITNDKLRITSSQMDLKLLLKELGKMGISSVLVEGGARVFESFLKQNLAQKFYWFKAPMKTGENALSVKKIITQLQKNKIEKTENFEGDLLTIGYLYNSKD